MAPRSSLLKTSFASYQRKACLRLESCQMLAASVHSDRISLPRLFADLAPASALSGTSHEGHNGTQRIKTFVTLV